MQNTQINPNQMTQLQRQQQQQSAQQPTQILPMMVQQQSTQQQQMHVNKGNMVHMQQHPAQMQPVSIMMKGPQGQMTNNMAQNQFRGQQVQMGNIQMQGMGTMNMNMPIQGQMGNIQMQNMQNTINSAAGLQNMPIQNMSLINVIPNNSGQSQQGMQMQSISSSVQNMTGNQSIGQPMNVVSSMGHNPIISGSTSIVSNILNNQRQPTGPTVVKMVSNNTMQQQQSGSQQINQMQPQVRQQFINQQTTQQMLNNQNSQQQIMSQQGIMNQPVQQQQIVNQMITQRNTQNILNQQQQAQQNAQPNSQILGQSTVGQILSQGNQQQQQQQQSGQMMGQHGQLIGQQNAQQQMMMNSQQNVSQILGQTTNQQQQNLPQLINQSGGQQQLNSLQIQLQNSQGNQQMNSQQQNQQVPGLINQLQSNQPIIGQQKMNPMFAQQQQQQQNQQQNSQQHQQILNTQRVNQIMSQQQTGNQTVLNHMGGSQQMLIQQTNGAGGQQSQNIVKQQQQNQTQNPQMFQQSQLRMASPNTRLLMQPQIRMQVGQNQMNMQASNQQLRPRQMMPNTGPTSQGPQGIIISQQQSNQPPVSLVFQQGTQVDPMNSQSTQRMNIVRQQVPTQQTLQAQQQQQTSQQSNQSGNFQQNFQHANLTNTNSNTVNGVNIMQLNNSNSIPIQHSASSSTVVGVGNVSVASSGLLQKNTSGIVGLQQQQQQQATSGNADSTTGATLLVANSVTPTGLQTIGSTQPNGMMSTSSNLPLSQSVGQIPNKTQTSMGMQQTIGSNKNMFPAMRMVLNNNTSNSISPQQMGSGIVQQKQMMQNQRLQVPSQSSHISANQQHSDSPQSFAVPSPMMAPGMMGSPGSKQMPLVVASPSGPINTPASPATVAAGHSELPLGSFSQTSSTAANNTSVFPDDEVAYMRILNSLQQYLPKMSFIIRQVEKDPRKTIELDALKQMVAVIKDPSIRVSIDALEGYEKFLSNYERSRLRNAPFNVVDIAASQVPFVAQPFKPTVPTGASSLRHSALTLLPKSVPLLRSDSIHSASVTLQESREHYDWQRTHEKKNFPAIVALSIGRQFAHDPSFSDLGNFRSDLTYVTHSSGISTEQPRSHQSSFNDERAFFKTASPSSMDDISSSLQDRSSMLVEELRELRAQGYEFENAFGEPNKKTSHLICKLKRPIGIPTILVYISDRYPDVAPYHKFDNKEYKATEQLRLIYQLFEHNILKREGILTLSMLLEEWRLATFRHTKEFRRLLPMELIPTLPVAREKV